MKGVLKLLAENQDIAVKFLNGIDIENLLHHLRQELDTYTVGSGLFVLMKVYYESLCIVKKITGEFRAAFDSAIFNVRI